jgi:hypothetical protein
MNENFVPQDIAKALKDLGFNEPCLAWWFEEGTVSVPTEGRSFWSDWNVNPKRISAPLIQQAFAWLRKKYQFMHAIEDIEVSASNTVGYRFRFVAWKLMNNEFVIVDKSLLGYLTYEQAELECIKEIIKYLKENGTEVQS